MPCSIDSFAAGQLILMGTNMAECDDALELDQTESHRIHLGKMPFKIGYIQVIINYATINISNKAQQTTSRNKKRYES